MALTGDFNFSCPISRPCLSQFVSTKHLHLFFPLCFFHTLIINYSGDSYGSWSLALALCFNVSTRVSYFLAVSLTCKAKFMGPLKILSKKIKRGILIGVWIMLLPFTFTKTGMVCHFVLQVWYDVNGKKKVVGSCIINMKSKYMELLWRFWVRK